MKKYAITIYHGDKQLFYSCGMAGEKKSLVLAAARDFGYWPATVHEVEGLPHAFILQVDRASIACHYIAYAIECIGQE